MTIKIDTKDSGLNKMRNLTQIASMVASGQ